MKNKRIERMLELYQKHKTDEDLIEMVAELRDNFLDHDVISAEENYDISTDTATGPEHVLFHIAKYIKLLEDKVNATDEVPRMKNRKMEKSGNMLNIKFRGYSNERGM